MKVIAIFYIVYILLSFVGCAYKGDVYIYSPQGDANAIDKKTDANADVSLMP